MPKQDKFAKAVNRVVSSQMCTGCGACSILSNRVKISMSSEGYLRPVVRAVSEKDEDSAELVRKFRGMCPGVSVPAPTRESSGTMAGTALAVWKAWATDSALRHHGSSGGVLTAIAEMLRTEGKVVISARVDLPSSRTVPVVLRTKEDVMEASGSKYSPVAIGNISGAETADAIIGKPCEAYAMRQIRREADPPIILSFFCAGTPSQLSTERILREGGLAPDNLSKLRYRGLGWPGRFSARDVDGNEVDLEYDDSWGRLLGPTVQTRCKFCVDGVGEHADIVAADFWATDSQGRPTFTENEGVSVLIARTGVGLEAILRARALGYLATEESSMDAALQVQPHQRHRRQTAWGRRLGAKLVGLSVTSFPGFGLWKLAMRSPLRNLKALLGAILRIVQKRPPVREVSPNPVPN